MAPFWQLHFDIDQYVNRIIPSPPWEVIPYPIAYFLGYRKHPSERQYGNILIVPRALVGVFVSLVLIQLISHQIPWVAATGPRIVASFGAAAVLEFCAFASPFAQPRNFIVSQIIASVVGVGLSKLFQLLRSDDDWVRWLGGALACATTTALMELTGTVHPPAGATALLAVVDDSAASIGWRLIPLVLLGCGVMLAVALLLNNVLTSFPRYWWTASDLSAFPLRRPDASSSIDGGDEESGKTQPPEILIVPGGVVVPEHIRLSSEEKRFLEQIADRL
ncbi:HPP family-domain-containing protein [Xylaria palmicola]|nr:HPP family-domain-containing protein [Xylaria palmicola]